MICWCSRLLLAILCLALSACASKQPTRANSPSTLRTPATSDTSLGERLRCPFHLPVLTPEGHCPTTASRQISPHFAEAAGNGPVYPVGLGANGLLQPAGPRRQAKVLCPMGGLT